MHGEPVETTRKQDTSIPLADWIDTHYKLHARHDWVFPHVHDMRRI